MATTINPETKLATIEQQQNKLEAEKQRIISEIEAKKEAERLSRVRAAAAAALEVLDRLQRADEQASIAFGKQIEPLSALAAAQDSARLELTTNVEIARQALYQAGSSVEEATATLEKFKPRQRPVFFYEHSTGIQTGLDTATHELRNGTPQGAFRAMGYGSNLLILINRNRR